MLTVREHRRRNWITYMAHMPLLLGEATTSTPGLGGRGTMASVLQRH